MLSYYSHALGALGVLMALTTCILFAWYLLDKDKPK